MPSWVCGPVAVPTHHANRTPPTPRGSPSPACCCCSLRQGSLAGLPPLGGAASSRLPLCISIDSSSSAGRPRRCGCASRVALELADMLDCCCSCCCPAAVAAALPPPVAAAGPPETSQSRSVAMSSSTRERGLLAGGHRPREGAERGYSRPAGQVSSCRLFEWACSAAWAAAQGATPPQGEGKEVGAERGTAGGVRGIREW